MFCKDFLEKPFSVVKYNFMAFFQLLDNTCKKLVPIQHRKKPDGETAMGQNPQRPKLGAPESSFVFSSF